VTEELPIVCSLRADDLRRRLDEIAALGAERLKGQAADGDARVLRFHSDPDTRRRLEEIVAAEARCCPFLDLSVYEAEGDLILRLAAPAEGAPVVAELARAFAPRDGR
jgi:hypothetical protein